MTHMHGHDTTVVERDGTSMTAGMMIGIAAILLIAIIGLVVLFAQPWDDNDGGGVTDSAPGIGDNSGGGAGQGDTNGGTGGDTGGGDSGGSTDGGTDPNTGQ